MKNFVLVLVAVFALTSFIGCNKKKKEDASDLNSVTTDNGTMTKGTAGAFTLGRMASATKAN